MAPALTAAAATAAAAGGGGGEGAAGDGHRAPEVLSRHAVEEEVDGEVRVE